MVSPPITVELAFEMNPCRVGKVENTRFPAVPVSSVMRVASSAEVSMEVVDILLLKTDQSDDERKPDCEALAC